MFARWNQCSKHIHKNGGDNWKKKKYKKGQNKLQIIISLKSSAIKIYKILEQTFSTKSQFSKQAFLTKSQFSNLLREHVYYSSREVFHFDHCTLNMKQREIRKSSLHHCCPKPCFNSAHGRKASFTVRRTNGQANRDLQKLV